jgi:hypothetical protein
MPVNLPQVNRDLADALKVYDRGRAEALAQELVEALRRRGEEEPISTGDAKATLGLLRRKRLFHLMQDVADAFLASGVEAPSIHRQLAQSLLDQGTVAAALRVLVPLVATTAQNASENAEARGLVGRAYKQLYVDGWRADAAPTSRLRSYLEDGVRAYWAVYDRDRTQLWHGINVVALLARALRDGVDLQGYPPPETIAGDILARVRNLHETVDTSTTSLTWDYATAVEACVALDEKEELLEWLLRYVASEGVDAFELASTQRQLREVWQLSATETLGAQVLPLLTAELMRREGGGLSQSPEEFRPPRHLQELDHEGKLEAILGTTRYVTYQWWLQALDRCRAVARITDDYGRAVGTGFLVRGTDLHEKLGGETLLLTNAHVMSPNPKAAPLRPAYARVTFTVVEGSPSSGVKEVIWTSGPWPGELDASLVRLDSVPAKAVPCPVCPEPVDSTPANQRFYIIGHPEGEVLSLSVQDNLLLDVSPPYLHYRTPTEKGSSGSPVFNDRWELVGLHHLGDTRVVVEGKAGPQAANEGVLLHEIRKAVTLT